MPAEWRIIIKVDNEDEHKTCPNCHESYQVGLYVVRIVQNGMSWFDYGQECDCRVCGNRFYYVRSYETVEQANIEGGKVARRLERFHTLGILMLVGRYPEPSLHVH